MFARLIDTRYTMYSLISLYSWCEYVYKMYAHTQYQFYTLNLLYSILVYKQYYKQSYRTANNRIGKYRSNNFFWKKIYIFTVNENFSKQMKRVRRLAGVGYERFFSDQILSNLYNMAFEILLFTFGRSSLEKGEVQYLEARWRYFHCYKRPNFVWTYAKHL